MTNDEREQVVELLRCAADLAQDNRCITPFTKATEWLGVRTTPLAKAAARMVARHRVNCPYHRRTGLLLEYQTHLLGAALLVEEGSWP